MRWKNYSVIKKGFILGLIVGVTAFILLVLLWGLQPLYFFGQEKCTNFHNSLWKCDFGYLVAYMLISVLCGIIITVISTLLGLFIGWSIGNKKVLKGEGIGVLIAIFLEIFIVFLSLILTESPFRTFLFGNYVGFNIGYFFESSLVLFIMGIGFGALIGFIIGKIKKRKK